MRIRVKKKGMVLVGVLWLVIILTVMVATMGNALSLLSADTGGTYYFNFANFNDPLREVVDDNSGYYLLSYSSERPAGESGYSRVTVKTRNPSFVVRARQGYRYGG